MNEIVVGVDGSETAGRAAATAAQYAADLGVLLHMVMCVSDGASEVVVGSERLYLDPAKRAQDFLGSLRFDTAPPEISTHVSFNVPARAICDEALRLDAQLIVVGNRRVQGISRVLGSVASDVMRDAPCDVLVAYTRG